MHSPSLSMSLDSPSLDTPRVSFQVMRNLLQSLWAQAQGVPLAIPDMVFAFLSVALVSLLIVGLASGARLLASLTSDSRGRSERPPTTDSRRKRLKWRKYALPILSVSVVGSVAGYIGGLSRIGVAGEIVAASLSLIGGLSVYLLGARRRIQPVVPTATIVFSLTLLGGFASGAAAREPGESIRALEEACLTMFTDPRTTQERLDLLGADYRNMCSAAMDNLIQRAFDVTTPAHDGGGNTNSAGLQAMNSARSVTSSTGGS